MVHPRPPAVPLLGMYQPWDAALSVPPVADSTANLTWPGLLRECWESQTLHLPLLECSDLSLVVAQAWHLRAGSFLKLVPPFTHAFTCMAWGS